MGIIACDIWLPSAKILPAKSTAMQIHFDAKHPKLLWEEEKVIDMHELIGATTQGLAVRGSTKKR